MTLRSFSTNSTSREPNGSIWCDAKTPAMRVSRCCSCRARMTNDPLRHYPPHLRCPGRLGQLPAGVCRGQGTGVDGVGDVKREAPLVRRGWGVGLFACLFGASAALTDYVDQFNA